MTIIVSDGFNVASNTLLGGRTPDTTGSAWAVISGGGGDLCSAFASTDTAGVANIQNNTKIWYKSAPDPGTDNYDIQIKITAVSVTTTAPLWLLGRFVDVDNYYAGGTYLPSVAADKKIVKRVSATTTEIASGDTDVAVNDLLKLEVRTGTLALKLNGTSVVSVSDSSITSTGSAGFALGNAGTVAADDAVATWRFDDYLVETIDTARRPLPALVVFSPTAPYLFGV